MHKTFYLACILGCAIAEDPVPVMETKEGPALKTATSGDIKSAGAIYETHVTMKDNDDEMEMIAFSLGWQTSNEVAPFENGSWIQNWAQWEDPDTAGLFWQVTCNVKFDNTVTESKLADVTVRALSGTTSIDAATVTTGGPLDIGTLTTEEGWGTGEDTGWQKCDDEMPELWKSCYETKNTATMSSQNCAAFWPISITINGEDKTEGEYASAKEKEWTVQTGFRMWLPADTANAAINVDAGETKYELMDWSSASKLVASGLIATAVLLQ